MNLEMINVSVVKAYLLSLQDQLTRALEQEDQQSTFHEDLWQFDNGSAGRTRVLQEGTVFEQAGVNFSHVYGDKMPAAATQKKPELAGCCFEAMGVSLVVHPRNPYVPTVHLNIRFFKAEKPGTAPIWWFGGGYDLTPYYGFFEDCQHWHRTAKAACDSFADDLYARLKRAADDYFFIKHRNEPRGIGGILFDDFNELGFARSFEFMQRVGDSFLPAYLPIVARRKQVPYDDKQRQFQCYRRGRYVEFNLVLDRGTLFGLQYGGRIESILMSLPPQVNWRYNWQPSADSEEARLYDYYLIPRDWIQAVDAARDARADKISD